MLLISHSVFQTDAVLYMLPMIFMYFSSFICPHMLPYLCSLFPPCVTTLAGHAGSMAMASVDSFVQLKSKNSELQEDNVRLANLIKQIRSQAEEAARSSPNVTTIPIPGMHTLHHHDHSLAALHTKLTAIEALAVDCPSIQLG